MDRRAYLRTVGGLSTVGLAGCAGLVTGPSDEPSDYDVGMSTAAFRPATLEVTVGQEVLWRNTSSHAHTVTAYESGIPDDAAFFASGGFDDEQAARDGWMGKTTGALYQGDEYAHTFDVPGKYQYFCIPHEQTGMIGTVTVSEA